MEQTQLIDHLPETDGRDDRIRSNKKCPKQFRCEFSGCSPNFKLERPRLHSGTACDRPETIKTVKFPPIPEAAWQQPQETFTDQYNLNNSNNDTTVQYTQDPSKTFVASQTSAPKRFQPQNYVFATKEPHEVKQRLNHYRSLAAPIIVLPITRKQ